MCPRGRADFQIRVETRRLYLRVSRMRHYTCVYIIWNAGYEENAGRICGRSRVNNPPVLSDDFYPGRGGRARRARSRKRVFHSKRLTIKFL